MVSVAGHFPRCSRRQTRPDSLSQRRCRQVECHHLSMISASVRVTFLRESLVSHLDDSPHHALNFLIRDLQLGFPLPDFSFHRRSQRLFGNALKPSQIIARQFADFGPLEFSKFHSHRVLSWRPLLTEVTDGSLPLFRSLTALVQLPHSEQRPSRVRPSRIRFPVRPSIRRAREALLALL
jgi:hypothetical protein